MWNNHICSYAKISNGRGRSRKLWPNVRYADTLVALKFALGYIKMGDFRWRVPSRTVQIHVWIRRELIFGIKSVSAEPWFNVWTPDSEFSARLWPVHDVSLEFIIWTLPNFQRWLTKLVITLPQIILTNVFYNESKRDIKQIMIMI